ncbi:MAG TPA: DUF2934 domain-containing protein [Steroidobacteraceae bacterium]|jgi:hypothetical protein|nr:DUF2934 domain-containing protein [Steroidobacteraceae bacterium]
MPTQPTPTSRSPRRSTAKTAATKSTGTTGSRAADATAPAKGIDPEDRRALIEQAAYFRAENRNFAPGFEVQDWLSAEAEVDTLLALGVPTTDH